EILAVVDWIGSEAVGEAVVPLRLRVVGALQRQIDRLAVLLLAFLVDLAMVDDVVLVDRPGPQESKKVMSLPGCDFRGSSGVDRGDPDVVDRALGVVLLAPLPDVSAVEPPVEAGHEVAPLKDLQLLLRALSEDLPVRPERSCDRRAAGQLHQAPSRETHGVPPRSRCTVPPPRARGKASAPRAQSSSQKSGKRRT